MSAFRTVKLFVLAMFLARPCWGGAGAEPLNFLFLDADARPVGLAGAYTALASDANALLYNPAGLARTDRLETTFMHNEYFQGVAQEYFGLASAQGWGANLNFLRFGDVPRTTISQPGGTGETATLNDIAVGLGYGRTVLPGLSAGIGAKWIRETIAGISAGGLAFDAGALYDVPAVERLTLGMSVQNMGRTVTYQQARENLPLNLRMGAAYRFALGGQWNTLSLDVTKERSQSPNMAVGVETVVAGALPLRMGYGTRNDAGPGIAAGIGWLLGDNRMDYAFEPFGELGSAHRFSVTWRWGKAREQSAW
ncbi:MAG: PorV/PorQ family protein [Elusimicrobiota bacterium]